MLGKIFLLPFVVQETQFFAQIKPSPIILQVIDCRFYFLHFLKKQAFAIDRLFIPAPKTSLHLKVRRSGVGEKLNVIKFQVQKKSK